MGRTLHPVFLDLHGRHVLLVGGGPVALEKARALADVGAVTTIVAPDVHPDLLRLAATIHRRPFQPADVDQAWYIVAAAPPAVNAEVRRAADRLCKFVNAVDDRDRASAFAASVIRRGPVTVAISTGGDAPALAKSLRQALERLLPADVSHWASIATQLRQRWLRDRTPMAKRHPELLAALADLHEQTRPTPAVSLSHQASSATLPDETLAAEPPTGRPLPFRAPVSPGLVSLVGAGPGHPDLLTRRGAHCLAEADVVLYDALVDPEMLTLAPRAQCVMVGRRKGRATLSQDGIHRVMIAAATRGRRVVRLKGGDPFVFGRGGEEALALARAGVPFEIVPGLSTAFAAPTLASIPVTHRDISSGVLVVSGHDEERFVRQVSGLPADEVTLVVLMGLSVRARLAQRLLEAGWAAAMPAAIVSAASRAQAAVRCTTLADLAGEDVTLDPPDAAPGTLLVGAVTRVRHELERLTCLRQAGVEALAGAARAEVCHG